MGAGSSLGDSFHIESHAPLLERPPAGELPYRTLDAIVVPTIRPQSLQTAVSLADEMRCALVVLCSTPAQAEQAMSVCGRPIGDVLATWIPQSVEHDWLAFLTSVHPEYDIERSCHADIAGKRNLGLLLARLCGWRTIMYLDDDIRDVTASAVSRAAALTSEFQAAGFDIEHFPDNSAVCHAYRLTGGQQDTFPGGSALVIDVNRCDTLFPPVYNEDWLFMFDAVRNRSVTVAGTASQLEYKPFAHSKRAASEEFGEIIAEGLYRLIHAEATLSDATSAYWHGVLSLRLQLIDHIAARLLLQDGPVAGSALMALAAARKRHAAISPLSCASFVHAWRTDIDAWQQRLLSLTAVADLAGAAKFLELPVLDR